MIQSTLTLIVLLLCSATSFCQIDPHAGMVGSFLDLAFIQVSSSSPNSPGTLGNDGNIQSFWTSDAVLPSGLLKRKDLNFLSDLGGTLQCRSSNNSADSTITDGSVYTACAITSDGQRAWLRLDVAPGTPIRSVSLKGQIAQDSMEVWIFSSNGDSTLLGGYTTADNYSLKRFDHIDTINRICVYAQTDFNISEICAISVKPMEFVVYDLGQTKNIAWFESRQYAPDDVDKIEVFLSQDSIQWQFALELDPTILGMVISRLTTSIPARYIKIIWTLKEENWKKARLWELKVYDKYGKFGPMPTPYQNSNKLSDMLGINGIFGWGNGVYSDGLPPGSGPDLFRRVASNVRNYHNMNWDTNDPDNTPNYAGMPGTLAQGWLDWDREYVDWVNSGLNVYTSIQFTDDAQPESMWDNPFQAGFQYGYSFAQHFGSTVGNGLIQGLEVGNEPWNYSADFYTQVLEGMASGAKTADPNFETFPCALQAIDSSTEINGYKNYAGYRLINSTIPYIDGYNAHHYSYYTDSMGLRRATYPEDYISSARGILNDLRFRDANMPGKKMFVTEWGWDSDGGGEACTHDECVNERAQAIYGVRYAMMLNRLGVDKMQWFFYANLNNGSSLYRRSGLTTSRSSSFQEKRSFFAFEAMHNLIGDSYFLDTLAENDHYWIYLLGDSNSAPTHIIAWRPVEESDTTIEMVDLPYFMMPDSTWKIEGLSPWGTPISNPMYQSGIMSLPLNSVPIIIKLKDAILLSNEQLASTNQWNVYPNPTYDQLYIDGIETDEGKLTLFDPLGRVIKTWGKIPPSVDLRAIDNGIYFLQIHHSGTTRTFTIHKK